jgi:hypothetical protein
MMDNIPPTAGPENNVIPFPGGNPAMTAGVTPTTPGGEILTQRGTDVAQGLAQLPNPSALVAGLQGKLDGRKTRRILLEQEWLECYRRYDGQYDAETLAKIRATGRCAMWLGFTGMKVHTGHAAVMEFLVGTDDSPWDLDPEPVPANLALPPQIAQMGITPQLIQEEVRRRTDALKSEMEGQLEDSDFVTHLDSATLEMCITGTGAMKGPITVRDHRDEWDMVLDTESYKLYPKEAEIRGYKPACKAISIFSCYPDMEVANVQQGDGFFEEEFLTRGEMIELCTEPEVDPLAVLAILEEHPYGNAEMTPELVQLRLLSGDTDPAATNRYAVYHYYGPITGRELSLAGMQIPREMQALQARAYVMFCAGRILRSRLHKGPIPYHLFPYVKRPGNSPFGKGIPMLARDTQDAINASGRMMIDNAAICSGPLIEANTALLAPGEDPLDIHAWRVFLSKINAGTGSAETRAIRVTDLKPSTQLFIALINLFRQFMDEATFIPSVTDGQLGVKAPKTATGTSILNSNSNRSMKTIMRHVDNYCIKPLVAGFYAWNMRYNPNLDILARVKVRTKGVAAVMARESQADRIMALTAAFGHQPWFKVVDGAREIVRAMDIPEDKLIATDEEMAGLTAPDIEGGEGATDPALGIPGGGAPVRRSVPNPTQSQAQKNAPRPARRVAAGG